MPRSELLNCVLGWMLNTTSASQWLIIANSNEMMMYVFTTTPMSLKMPFASVPNLLVINKEWERCEVTNYYLLGGK